MWRLVIYVSICVILCYLVLSVYTNDRTLPSKSAAGCIPGSPDTFVSVTQIFSAIRLRHLLLSGSRRVPQPGEPDLWGLETDFPKMQLPRRDPYVTHTHTQNFRAVERGGGRSYPGPRSVGGTSLSLGVRQPAAGPVSKRSSRAPNWLSTGLQNLHQWMPSEI